MERRGPLLRLIIWTLELLKTIVYHGVVCFKNARTLLSLLLRGTRTWVYMLGRLLIFTVVLTPGWIYLLRYWLFSPYILRNIEYGKGAKNRNLLDVYLPETYNPHSTRSTSKTSSTNANTKASNRWACFLPFLPPFCMCLCCLFIAVLTLAAHLHLSVSVFFGQKRFCILFAILLLMLLLLLRCC
jgi:hypothetical protein